MAYDQARLHTSNGKSVDRAARSSRESNCELVGSVWPARAKITHFAQKRAAPTNPWSQIYKYTVQYNHDGIQKKSPDLYKSVSLGKLNLYK